MDPEVDITVATDDTDQAIGKIVEITLDIVLVDALVVDSGQVIPLVELYFEIAKVGYGTVGIIGEAVDALGSPQICKKPGVSKKTVPDRRAPAGLIDVGERPKHWFFCDRFAGHARPLRFFSLWSKNH